MKIIAGLGNPGNKYKNTFHNVGFQVVDAFCNKNKIGPNFKENKKFKALILEENFNGEKTIFIKPLTFMNNSGEAVSKVCNFYKVEPRNLIVVHDDLDIGLGEIKISLKRSSAGHRGIESIIKYLGTNDFSRVRIGIKKENLKMAAEKYVLKNPNFFEKIKIKNGIKKGIAGLKEILEKGVENAMTKFN